MTRLTRSSASFRLVNLAAIFLTSASAAHATKFWKNSVGNGNWNTGINWSAISAASADNGGVPVAGEAVNIVNTAGGPRTVTYDVVNPLTIGALTVDFIGADTNTLAIGNANNNLSATSIFVGSNSGAAPASNGAVNQTAGSVTVLAGSSFLGLGVFGGSKGTYTLGGTATLKANTGEFIGILGTGVFTQNGALSSNTIAGTGNSLVLGNNTNGDGTYTLNDGTLTVTSGFEYLGYVNQSKGTFNQNGGINTSTGLFLGNIAGSTGTYNLNGGLLVTNGVENIGFRGTGNFNQTSGTNKVNGALAIAPNAGSTGVYALTGGTATITGALTIGTGGALNVSNTGHLSLPILSLNTAMPNNAITLSGNGTIDAAALSFDSVPLNADGLPASQFNWTTGTLNLTQNVTWDSALPKTTTSGAFGSVLTLGAGKTLKVSGNETIGGSGPFTLKLANGSTNEVTGTLTLTAKGTLIQEANAILKYGTFALNGATIPSGATFKNNGAFVFQSGQFNGKFENVGIGSISFTGPSFTIPEGIVNDIGGTLTVDAGKTLIANGTGLENSGVIAAKTPTAHTIALINATVVNNPTGDIRSFAGDRLNFAGTSFTNKGFVQAIGSSTNLAEIDFDVPVTNARSAVAPAFTGLISGRFNVYRFNQKLSNDALFTISFGPSDIFGEVTNTVNGKTNVTDGATATFHNIITQHGSFTVTPGSTAVFLGEYHGVGATGGGTIAYEGGFFPGASPASVTFENNVDFGAGSSTNIEIGGTAPGTQYDQVHVAQLLSLGGTLDVTLLNGFAPAAGSSFDIFDWGSLSGAFSSIQLPALAAGLQWDTSQLYTTGVLSVIGPGLPGDFNGDGAVNQSDYIVWRKGLGTRYTQSDYDVWRAHIGQTSGALGGGLQGSTVPEPAGLLSLAIFLFAPLLRWRR
jgi:hypothetical protein